MLVKIGTEIRESYWFVPSLMVSGAILLSLVATYVDRELGSEWIDQLSWLDSNQPEGAREVLSTIAGSMITVAGVTFSMTILSISYTTGQVGPRLLNNFMRDTSNQFTLGVFISTFVYCLMVLRTVRSGESSSAAVPEAFVPHVAVTLGLLMALISVGVLIYFIHHIPESIHISNIVAGIGRDIQYRIEQQYPLCVGPPLRQPSAAEIERALPGGFYEQAQAIGGEHRGYVEYVDRRGLLELAQEFDLLIRLRFRAGDFVTPATVLMLVSGPQKLDSGLRAKLANTFVCGSQRTATQNLRFQFNQLIEVAVRALSPGVNDPFTAMICMDWLRLALETCAARDMPQAYDYDEQSRLRVVSDSDGFTTFVDLVCDQLRPYVACDRNAALHMMKMLAQLSVTVSDPHRRRWLLRHASRLRRECRRHLADAEGVRSLRDHHRRLIRLLRDEAYQQHVQQSGCWVETHGT